MTSEFLLQFWCTLVLLTCVIFVQPTKRDISSLVSLQNVHYRRLNNVCYNYSLEPVSVLQEFVRSLAFVYLSLT